MFCIGGKEIIEDSIMSRVLWQEKLLKKILFHVTARINNTRLSQEEKRVKKEKVEERLRRLEYDTEVVKRTLEDEAKRSCETVSEKLHAYIHDQETVKKLKQWDINTDIPVRESDLALIEHEAKEKILAKVGREIKIWCENERLTDITSELANRFREEYCLIEEQCQDIDNLVQDVSSSVDLDDIDDKDEELSHRVPLFAGKEKLALVLTAPLWVPLMVLAFSVALPVMGVIAIKENFNEKQISKSYRQNKKAFMDEWADEVLSRFSLEAISSKLEMTYMDNFYKCLDRLCDVVIPRQIESDRELIVNIQKEERRSSAIRRQYHPLEKRCQCMTGKLLLVQMEYFYEDKIMNKNITKGDYLGKGSFATVYKAEVVIGDERKSAAVKCMTQPLEYSDSYSQLTEVTTLIKCSHGWIVKLYGISYEEIGSHKYLQIIMELCDFTLSSRIFPRRDGSPAPVTSCSQFLLTSSEVNPSLNFFKRVSMDVCKALVYIHKKNLIHRDLKPSNILLQGSRAKIADVGLTKETDLITGTLAGTPAYIAPEVILTKLYGTEVDIYSLGVLLWELWYGARAYHQDGIGGHQIFEQVKAGHRPSFYQSHIPPTALQKLMKRCWHENRKCRPEAGEIYDIIKEQLFK
ncbi:dual serine/threonine and tyrosine protein kinase-like [Mizuhopecten yessoensis]|uniref:dual serine/threonine and tyrosine protein kinase-like n=1 Tax=Mizuhopecten yessoensis TaxID=6573 RepID=UPI000B459A3D|nr:dual serine/threonine and tyrosine protein kinase-like [Mizuhopecten yessoensis]